MAFSEANDRIFYACQAVLMERVEDGPPSSAYNPTSATDLAGVRSVGVNGDFPSTSLMDVGRFQKKFHYYGKHSFEVTFERVINQADNTESPNVRNSFFYEVDPSNYTTTYTDSHILSTAQGNIGDKGTPDGSDKHLAQYHITILYGPDKFSRFGAGISGEDEDKDKVYSVTYEYCLVTSINYRFDTTGAITESVTLVTRSVKYNSSYETTSAYDFLASPYAAQSGNVLKSQDLDIETNTKFPSELASMFDLSTTDAAGNKILGLTSMDISIGFNYREVDDVGLWRGADQTTYTGDDLATEGLPNPNLWRFLTLPVEITTSFTGLTRHMFPRSFPRGDYLFGSSDFVAEPSDKGAWQEVDEQIRIVAEKFPSGPSPTYFIWDLGEKNYLTSIDHSGGAADGGNVETTLTYQNDNSDIVIARDTSVRDISYPTTPY